VLGDLPRGGIPLIGTTIDGEPFDLASLRGRVAVVAFEASWAGVGKPELASLDPAGVAFGSDAAIVRVDSDEAVADARAGVPPGAHFTALFDGAPGNCSPVGPITHSWGVDKVPETFLVDRAGNVRFHFVGARDWSSRDAVACVTALALDRTPPLASPPLDVPDAPACDAAPSDPAHVIDGIITISPRVPAGTKIVVVAKPATGGPPLAATRLPYNGGGTLAFHLDDQDEMLQGTPLTGEVVVTAIYDQDGDILSKQPGDLVGSAKVTVPASGVAITLDRPR